MTFTTGKNGSYNMIVQYGQTNPCTSGSFTFRHEA
jgi:hypothetical protein